ncbi:TPA: hypothetical protein KKQ22_004651 [Shigella sonnei]|nr:hypothetical protein [Shigella sonnei]
MESLRHRVFVLAEGQYPVDAVDNFKLTVHGSERDHAEVRLADDIST